MGTSAYPGALDNFSESSPTYMADPDATGRTHAGRHDDVESAVEQVEETLGVNPQGPNATVAERLAPITTLNGKVGIGIASPAGVLDAGNATGRIIVGDAGGNVFWGEASSFAGPDWQTRANIDANGIQEFGRRVTTSYWDESVGRRLFVWDTTNGRWQMVYGDTGDRDIVSLLENGWTGRLRIRRVGSLVTIAGLVNGASATADIFLTVPAGFGTPPEYSNTFFSANETSGAPVFTLVSWDQKMQAAKGITAGLNFTFVYETSSNWPTTLPGVAVGVIPTAENLLPGQADIDPNIPTGLTPDDDTSDWTVTYPDGPTP